MLTYSESEIRVLKIQQTTFQVCKIWKGWIHIPKYEVQKSTHLFFGVAEIWWDRFVTQNTWYKIQIKHPGFQEEQTILAQVKPTSANPIMLHQSHDINCSPDDKQWRLIWFIDKIYAKISTSRRVASLMWSSMVCCPQQPYSCEVQIIFGCTLLYTSGLSIKKQASRSSRLFIMTACCTIHGNLSVISPCVIYISQRSAWTAKSYGQ